MERLIKRLIKRLTALLAALVLLGGLCAAQAETAAEIPWTTKLTVRFATVEDGRQLMRGRTLFHGQLSDETLPFYLQRKGGTLEEYIEYSEEQVLAFSPDETERISDTLSWLQAQLEKYGLRLPDPGEITLVLTTGEDMPGAAGYTTGGTIFMNRVMFDRESYADDVFREFFLHEIFHSLTRLYPEFRRAMYSIIHFTLLEQDIDVPEELLSQVIANPDVEHHDSCASFTIEGKKKDCYLLFLTDTVFENPGDTLFDGMYTGIVPLDGSRVYRAEEVPDFWDVVGRNTDYAEDPEEIMATNFALAILHLEDGYGAYESPEILQAIVDCLKN